MHKNKITKQLTIIEQGKEELRNFWNTISYKQHENDIDKIWNIKTIK